MMNWLKLALLGGAGAALGPLGGLLGPGAVAGTMTPFNPAMGGLLSGAGFGEAMKGGMGVVKDIGAAAQAANSVKGLLGSDQPMAQAAPMQAHGNDPIAQILAQQAALEDARKKARYGIA